jgi:hypothetical protein
LHGDVVTANIFSDCLEITSLDIVHSAQSCFLEEELYAAALSQLHKYQRVIICMPDATFRRRCSRSMLPMRNSGIPGIYGTKDLAPAEKEAVRCETAIAIRLAELVRHATRASQHWTAIVCTVGFEASVFELPEWATATANLRPATLQFPGILLSILLCPLRSTRGLL